MNKQLAHPLQSIVKKAATTLPAATGAVAVQQRRIDRRRGRFVILADISHSMNSPAWGQVRKIDVLREAVTATMRRADCTLIAFSDSARVVDSIPEPEASTDLAAGLRAAKAFDPGVTLLISDGQPNDPATAIALARTFRGVVDVLYVGPDSDAAAIAFMRKLAAAADGDVQVNDISSANGSQRLLGSITALLPAPPP